MRIDAPAWWRIATTPLQMTHRRLAMFVFFLAWLASDQCLVAANTGSAAVRIKRSIVYKTLNSGDKLLADVYLPPKSEGPRPTLLMIHGGAWFSGNKVHVAYHANYAAEQGYAVVAINYRLAPKFKFPAQLEDCRDALAWLAEHADEYEFDTERVAVYGYSAGAHLACLVGVSQNGASAQQLTASENSSANVAAPLVRAVVAGGAPCEFSWIPREAKTLAYWLGDSRQEKPGVYAAATPLEFVDKDDPPVFLFHGTADRIVPPQSSQKMLARLTEANVVSQRHVVQKAGHLGAFLDKTAREKAVSFLNQHLQP